MRARSNSCRRTSREFSTSLARWFKLSSRLVPPMRLLSRDWSKERTNLLSPSKPLYRSGQTRLPGLDYLHDIHSQTFTLPPVNLQAYALRLE
jgi:hypothetical protein